MCRVCRNCCTSRCTKLRLKCQFGQSHGSEDSRLLPSLAAQEVRLRSIWFAHGRHQNIWLADPNDTIETAPCGGSMNNDGNDSFSSRGSGSWWSRLSQHEQIVAAIIGALITGLFGITIALISISSGPSRASTSSATGSSSAPVASSPAPVASSPITSETATKPAPHSSTPSSESVVEVPSPAPSASSSRQYLAELTPVSGNVDLYTGSAAVNGSNYLNSVMLYMALGGSTSAAYNIERQWRSLEATVGLRDDSPQKEEFELQVFADGNPIYSHLFGLGQSQHIKLNIVGVLRLELRGTLVGALYGDAYGVWGNAALTK
jgi:NPCBM/NEW2 domain